MDGNEMKKITSLGVESIIMNPDMLLSVQSYILIYYHYRHLITSYQTVHQWLLWRHLLPIRKPMFIV